MGQYSQGAVTCSFNDYKLSEYIKNQRQTAGRLPVKCAVNVFFLRVLGAGCWVLGAGCLAIPILIVWFRCWSYNNRFMCGWGIFMMLQALLTTTVPAPLSIDPLKSLYFWAKETWVKFQAVHDGS